MHYPLRKGKKDPKGDSEVIKTAISTIGSDYTGLREGYLYPSFRGYDFCPAEPHGRVSTKLKEYL